MVIGRPISTFGGILLIVASLLPFGYEEWFSGSLFEFVMDVFSHINDFEFLQELSLQIDPNYGTSGLIIGLVIASFFLLVIGGILGLLHFRGGSIAGPAGMIILTILPIYRDGASGISTLGIGFYVGWIGAILCAITLFMSGKKETKVEAKKQKRDKKPWEDDPEYYGHHDDNDDGDDGGNDNGDDGD